ncbi:TadE/TadG family type IV pilus assembly protein [Sphingomonas sp. GCM10030256]|uniref:TadE/TadG family type IV pilus assembly protein n=1 Tax=Sphingomonas sp. GCM10030256 TaxID=3273427 RepID=UPI003620F5A2
MKCSPTLFRDQQGTAIIELAFALPCFVILIWTILQLGLVYNANSGIQNALGQGARYATLFPKPTNSQIETKMSASVWGIKSGTFTNKAADPVDDPATAGVDESKAGYKDLTVTYTQPTTLLIFPGPNVTITKSKRVWVAS